MIFKVIAGLIAARDILRYAVQLWNLAQQMRRADDIRKEEQAVLEKLKQAQTEKEVEDAARSTLGGF